MNSIERNPSVKYNVGEQNERVHNIPSANSNVPYISETIETRYT